MQLLSPDVFLKMTSPSFADLPYCFLPNYLKKNDGFKVAFDKHFASVVHQKRNKGFKTIQFLSPPFRLNGERADTQQEKIFCETFLNLVRKENYAHRIVQPLNQCLFQVFPKNSTHVAFGSYRLLLAEKTEEQLLQNMPRYRNPISQTEKLSPIIKTGVAELSNFYSLYKETMLRSGAFAISYKQLNKEVTALGDYCLIANVYINQELQGGLFIAFTNYCAYYLHGASSQTKEAQGAIKYLHFKMMSYLRDKGVSYYDFVGARLSENVSEKIQGIQDFKRRFGGELIKGVLWKADISPLRCKIQDTLLQLKCSLKGNAFPKDIIDQELEAIQN
jgi:hypothetical protein